MIRIIVLSMFIIGACGCNKEDPNPHLRDPIYRDLKGQADAHQNAIEVALKKLAELKKTLDKAEANSTAKRDIRRDIAKAEAELLNNRQWALYYKIRADRRVVVDKITAKEAFLADKPWPDPREYSDYLVNSRLRQVNLNWGSRVPRLQDRLTRSPAKSSQGDQPPKTEKSPPPESEN